MVLLELTSQICCPRAISLAKTFAVGKRLANVTKVKTMIRLLNLP